MVKLESEFQIKLDSIQLENINLRVNDIFYNNISLVIQILIKISWKDHLYLNLFK